MHNLGVISDMNMITGITGQDGILLSKLLRNQGEKFFGVITKYSDPLRVELLRREIQDVNLIQMPDFSENSFSNVLRDLKPKKIFNFASISSVKLSFEKPDVTHEINYQLFANLISAVEKVLGGGARVFQSSSSEMFGNSGDESQNESTQFKPVSPYGESKLRAHLLARESRNKGLFVTTGILFNHESEYRKEGFVVEKVTSYMAKRKHGATHKLELGDINVTRDWGYAGDFVRGMHKSLSINDPNEFVFATGETKSISDLVEISLEIIGDKSSPEDFIVSNSDLKRPNEKRSSKGDFSRAQAVLGWQPETSFEQMLRKLIDFKLDQKK
jgi:GDPmannose 4,6-dehydratase